MNESIVRDVARNYKNHKLIIKAKMNEWINIFKDEAYKEIYKRLVIKAKIKYLHSIKILKKKIKIHFIT